jgi:hypothetical protein
VTHEQILIICSDDPKSTFCLISRRPYISTKPFAHDPEIRCTRVMPFILLPAEISDVPAMAELFLETFLSTCEITRRIYPNGATSSIIEYVIETNIKQFKDPHVVYMKVVEAEDGNGQRKIHITQDVC